MKRAPVALVTGAGRGIGRGIAWALAEAGYDVVVNDLERNAPAEETLAGVAARGRRAVFVPGDIAALEGHAALVAAAWSAFGALDCLVNNAGVQVRVRGDMLDVTPESFDRLIAINLRGTFFLTQTVAKRMVAEKRKPDDPPRAIVTISSANAITVVGPNRAEYCIAKTGLAMMSQLYAERLAQDDIMCYEIRPGIIRTDMTAPAAARYDKLIADGISPVRRWGEPADVGRTVAALASRLLPFNTGDAFHVDGGFHMKVM
ncbi:MAG: 3-ketoacyl-ACP reductase [Proteobacteria bacterium]|nr:3-ketoacyl-ACP reductase [Pseudomonadota bacterium]